MPDIIVTGISHSWPNKKNPNLSVTAWKGEILRDVTDEFAEEACRYGVCRIYNPEEEAAKEEAVSSGETVETLTAWFEAEKPTVDQMIERAGGDPGLAQKLLEVEIMMTAQSPRKGVAEGLQSIIDSAS